jgi:hypothetical protein
VGEVYARVSYKLDGDGVHLGSFSFSGADRRIQAIDDLEEPFLLGIHRRGPEVELRHFHTRNLFAGMWGSSASVTTWQVGCPRPGFGVRAVLWPGAAHGMYAEASSRQPSAPRPWRPMGHEDSPARASALWHVRHSPPEVAAATVTARLLDLVVREASRGMRVKKRSSHLVVPYTRQG